MHTGGLLFSADFDVSVNGASVGVDGLLPGWDARDRFGIVVDGTLDIIGASLLTQAAIAAHFDVRPQRRGPHPVYPEIFVFHVGGRRGDHSNYDFWPPRKEVILPTRSPSALLTEINARAITRLALPDLAPADPTCLGEGPSTWAEQYSARDRIVSWFAYSPSGSVGESDIAIRALDARLAQNTDSTLHPLETVEAVLAGDEDLAYTEDSASDLPAELLAGIPEDNRRWAAEVRARIGEVDPARMRELISARQHATLLQGETPPETYRRLDIDTALGVLAALA
jgi:hypothetical protein